MRDAERKPIMLIVDDDAINRAILANIFEADYAILEAENGAEGWQWIRAHADALSAVLLDVVMPEMNGLELMRHLAQEGFAQKTPVFLITADASNATMQEAYSLGVMDVISKPVVPYIVRRRVESVVELFEARRRLSAQVARQQDQLLRQAQQLAQMGIGMVEALATAIEFRSDESGEHVRRIHDITCHLLRHTPLGAGLTEEDIQLIGMASITHDVGKIAIPDAILNKNGRLTKEEYEIMKTHAQKGAELLAQIPQLRWHASFSYAYVIALHHHERWYGRGYPDGLVGEETPVWTQIVALADVYDALVSKRCYKEAYSFDTAVHMIVEGQCGIFGPRILEHFQAAEPALRKMYLRGMEGKGI